MVLTLYEPTGNSPKTTGSLQRPKVGFQLDETLLIGGDAIEIIRSSQDHGWQELYVAHTHEYPHSGLYQPVPFFWLAMTLTETEIRRNAGGHEQVASLPAYSISMVEPFTEVECGLLSETEAVHIFLQPSLLYEVAQDLYQVEPSQVSLLPILGVKSASLSWLLRSIKQTLSEPVGFSHAKIAYLARALCADLLAKFSILPDQKGRHAQPVGFTTRQLQRIDAFIEQRLGQDLRVVDLASFCAMGISTFHQRFKAARQMTPHQYIMRQRVGKAQEMLVANPSLSLSEIALACGFSDQAHFATLFKRITGTTPTSFRWNAL